MADAGKNQHITEGEFITTTFDSFSNQTVSKYNLMNGIELSGKAFYGVRFERMQSSGATEDDEPFDAIRFIFDAKSTPTYPDGTHQRALDDWDALTMNRITFNCDDDNIVIEETWKNTPEVIDEYPGADHHLYYSFNSCLFLMDEKQLKKIVQSNQFDVRIDTNYSHVDLDDDEEERLLNSMKVFYHEVYDKETLADGIESIIDTERERIEIQKKAEAEEAQAGGCFIATAVYENENHFNLIVLRSFRDNYLRTFKLGRGFIKFYYRYGPSLGKLVSKSRLLKYLFMPFVEMGVFIVKILKIG